MTILACNRLLLDGYTETLSTPLLYDAWLVLMKIPSDESIHWWLHRVGVSQPDNCK